jgi:hypothetical protein
MRFSEDNGMEISDVFIFILYLSTKYLYPSVSLLHALVPFAINVENLLLKNQVFVKLVVNRPTVLLY